MQKSKDWHLSHGIVTDMRHPGALPGECKSMNSNINFIRSSRGFNFRGSSEILLRKIKRSEPRRQHGCGIPESYVSISVYLVEVRERGLQQRHRQWWIRPQRWWKLA